MKIYNIILFMGFCVANSYAQSPQKISYVYDDLSRLSEVNYPNGTKIVYTYDLLGNRQTLVITNGACTPPAVPTVSSTTINSGQATTLTASGCADTVTWYADATGGTGLTTGVNYTTPALNTTTTYYASCMVSSCESSRGSGTVTVNGCTPPAAPTVSSISINSGQTATLTATGCTGTITWYVNANGGSGLTTGTTYISPTLTTTTTYYASCTVSGCESSRGSGTVTVNAGCPVPTVMQWSNTTATSFQPRWNAIAGYSYIIRYKAIGTSTWTEMTPIVSSSTGTQQTIITGLSNGVTYEWQVKTVCSVGNESAFSTSTNSSTFCQSSNLGSPLATGISSTFAYINWGSFGIPLTYNLRWKVSGASTWNTLNALTGNTIKLTGLMPLTKYEVQIQTICEGGILSSFSNTMTFTTTQLPCNVSLNHLTGTYVPNTYQASTMINSSIDVGNPTTYFAGKSINLLPGFQAGANEVFVARIQDCPSLNRGLVGYYIFNGNANDLSGFGNHGTNFNATLTTDKYGNSNSAYNFGGVATTAFISVNNSSTLQFSTTATFSLWYNLNSYQGMDGYGSTVNYGVHTLFAKEGDWSGLYARVGGDQTNDKMWVDLGNNAVYDFGVGDSFTTLASNLNVWIHLVYVINGNTVKVYRDGILTQTHTLTNSFDFSASNSKNLYFGRYGNSTWYPFNGKLDDIRIYNRALNDQEVQSIYTLER